MSREILIQEQYRKDPWKMLVSCILLNQTNNHQVRPILDCLFELIPDPESAASCDPFKIAETIKSTGLQNIKTSRIQRMSQKWIDGFEKICELPGIGNYGKDSWEIFINNNLEISPKDKKLKMYLDQSKNTTNPNRLSN